MARFRQPPFFLPFFPPYLPPSLSLLQLLSDLIPLRIIPPVLLAGLTTLLVGFRGGLYFFNYTLALVLLSCVAAVINGVIGMLGGSKPPFLPLYLPPSFTDYFVRLPLDL